MNTQAAVLLLVLLLAGVSGEAAELAAEARAGYEAALQKDARAFEEALRDLNRRFKESLEKLHVNARERGDLDETLAARQLWERVRPLTTVVVFRADAPMAGTVACPLPAAPDGKGLTAQAYTSYLAKAAGLANQFNAVASNRLARLVSGLDAGIRERTKSGDLDTAVRFRDLRTAAQRSGAPSVSIGAPVAPTQVAAVPNESSSAFLGRWHVPGVGRPLREFRSDGRSYYFDTEGSEEAKIAPYQIDSTGAAVVQRADGWIDIYRLRSATEGVLEARNQSTGQIVTKQFLREGVVPGGHPILGTWCDTWDAGYPGRTRVFDPQGIVRGIGSNGVEYWRAPYKLTGSDAADFVRPDGIIGRYRVLPDGRLQCTHVRTNGAVEVVYCTRPGVGQAMTVWAPGDEAKGTWVKDWMFEGRGVQTGLARLKESHNGRERLWETHPVNAATPAKWIRSVQLAAGKPHALRLDVCAGRGCDWELSILVNGDELLKRVIAGDAWQTIEINLNRYAGQRVKVELHNGGGGNPRWSNEYAYWDNVRLD